MLVLARGGGAGGGAAAGAFGIGFAFAFDEVPCGTAGGLAFLAGADPFTFQRSSLGAMADVRVAAVC